MLGGRVNPIERMSGASVAVTGPTNETPTVRYFQPFVNQSVDAPAGDPQNIRVVQADGNAPMTAPGVSGWDATVVDDSTVDFSRFSKLGTTADGLLQAVTLKPATDEEIPTSVSVEMWSNNYLMSELGLFSTDGGVLEICVTPDGGTTFVLTGFENTDAVRSLWRQVGVGGAWEIVRNLDGALAGNNSFALMAFSDTEVCVVTGSAALNFYMVVDGGAPAAIAGMPTVVVAEAVVVDSSHAVVVCNNTIIQINSDGTFVETVAALTMGLTVTNAVLSSDGTEVFALSDMDTGSGILWTAPSTILAGTVPTSTSLTGTVAQTENADIALASGTGTLMTVLENSIYTIDTATGVMSTWLTVDAISALGFASAMPFTSDMSRIIASYQVESQQHRMYDISRTGPTEYVMTPLYTGYATMMQFAPQMRNTHLGNGSVIGMLDNSLAGRFQAAMAEAKVVTITTTEMPGADGTANGKSNNADDDLNTVTEAPVDFKTTNGTETTTALVAGGVSLVVIFGLIMFILFGPK